MIPKGSIIKCPICKEYVFEALVDLTQCHDIFPEYLRGLQGQELRANEPIWCSKCKRTQFAAHFFTAENWEKPVGLAASIEPTENIQVK